MRKIFTVGVLVMTFALVSNAYAANQNNVAQGQGSSNGIHEPGTGLENPELKEENQGTGQGIQTQQKLQDGTGTVNQVQNQNQVKNQGEANQVQTSEQEGTQNETEAEMVVAQQRRSQVANAVHEMLQVADRNGGIGQQVKTIAQTQTQNQEKLESSLEKVQSRSDFAKFFVGPNYGEINNAKKILEQNREQVKQLNRVKNQLANQSDEQTLTEQIKTLEQANLEIEDSLETAQKGFSLFGWMFRMFSN